LLQEHHNYVVVFPNNDLGAVILTAYEGLKIHVSEFFVTLLNILLTLLRKAHQ
jgi:hypothetical protein